MSDKQENRKVFIENVVNKLVRVEVDINERINREMIDSTIRNEIERSGMSIDYF